MSTFAKKKEKIIRDPMGHVSSYYTVSKSLKGIYYLNTRSIVIGDIDFKGNRDTPPTTQKQALELINKVGSEYGVCAHVFRTQNGLRFFCDASHLGFSQQLTLLKMFRCDSTYIICCEKHGQFSARASPKSFFDFTGIYRLGLYGKKEFSSTPLIKVMNKHDELIERYETSIQKITKKIREILK
ncbi:hypothetical protein Lepto7376_3879 [[Leptolyngbya] sp. PCC 7376]|uniref:hypothetical protein n=1 Tax=[Leptolyngbya] sp. PCC 7376 TaxID=111781 RepID=UPI00029EC675|nr:hypothetical protein [[Leptolyngbya] sp. PCC 7376]AFY40035.1 hypothetical protein Lepto7376_3879 [[Leptolyngbya] sp. PCC 7376]